jgi:hypothetical protein
MMVRTTAERFVRRLEASGIVLLKKLPAAAPALV